ncbi:MAG TPA: hypothetical protein VK281_18230, partial [Xanthobacteraceae bacterium]|nr:hypothetical protein [Xanthobacteraceae bacterium]
VVAGETAHPVSEFIQGNERLTVHSAPATVTTAIAMAIPMSQRSCWYADSARAFASRAPARLR